MAEMEYTVYFVPKQGKYTVSWPLKPTPVNTAGPVGRFCRAQWDRNVSRSFTWWKTSLEQGKPTYRWGPTYRFFNRKYIFKRSIFHCYVSLLECNISATTETLKAKMGWICKNCLDIQCSINVTNHWGHPTHRDRGTVRFSWWSIGHPSWNFGTHHFRDKSRISSI